MALTPGSRLGPYEILAAIGAGGMGEVYRARDTRLDRTVAIKVLPGALAADPEFRQRFDREARAISQLDHPHICTLYDVGEDRGTAYLVMQYLEGETLEDRLKKGALPLDQVLKTAIEITSALDKAHRAGIVHRDLKPGNIMLTKSGAKLLDFGLAKTSPIVSSGTFSMLPTTPPAAVTAQGTILGTFQYMAPEQLEGQEADARTDVFAFGAVVYEMLTGRKAFVGKTQASLIGAILKDEPAPVSATQPVSPPVLDRIVRTCLAKDPDDRWQTVRDVMLQLRWVAESGSVAGVPVPVAHRRKHRERAAWAVAAAFAAAFGALAVSSLWRAPAEVRTVRFSVSPNSGTAFGPENAPIKPFPAISPDGKLIAFVAQEPGEASMLWVRSLDSVEAQALLGTEGASLPFWSPDSRHVAFSADSKLKKVDAAGGPVQVLCDQQTATTAGGGMEGTWARNGVIVFGDVGSGLFRVSDAGGKPTAITTPSKELKETAHRAPSFLPDGRHFLYLAQPPNVIYARALDSTDPPKRLLAADSRAVYAAPGYLLFIRQGTLMGQRFDPERLELIGEAFPVAENMRVNVNNGRAAFAVSDNGTLVYRAGTALVGLRVVWFDRNGKITDDINQTDDNRLPRLSPDEKRIVVQRRSSGGSTDLWLIDLARGTNTKLTFGAGDETNSIWSPDGSRVAYQASPEALYAKAVTGIAKEELLLKMDQPINALNDWSLDGQQILFTVVDPETGVDIWMLPLSGERRPQPVVKTPFNQNRVQTLFGRKMDSVCIKRIGQ